MAAPYPMAIAPVAITKVWGGHELAALVNLEDPPAEPVGEVWSLSALPGKSCPVANGALAGVPLDEALDQLETPLPKPFPVMLKCLETNEPISLQLHPSDVMARRRGHPCGKSEAWLVLKAAPDAAVIHGLRSAASDVDGIAAPPPTGEDLAAFVRCLRGNAAGIERYLRSIPVKDGDVIPVPPGTVHSTRGHIVWAEVQQSADLTYRLHDWGRQGREMHVEQALEALAPRPLDGLPLSGLTLESGPCTRRLLWACPAFIMEEISVSGHWSAPTKGRPFEVLMGLRGKPQVECRGDALPVLPGRCVLIPGGLAFSLSARAAGRVLRVYQADLDAEVVPALTAAGHTPEKIAHFLNRD
jgi:mannose-6-phosphate isomerase